jgi:hypothetical protein
MAATFNPPHPQSVFRYLKTAFREYRAAGAAASINVTTPPNQARTAPTVVAGTVEIDRSAGVVMPASVTAILTQSSTTKGTQVAAVDPVTGAYTTSFAGSTLAVGTATATVSCTDPVESTTTPSFTLS